MHGFGKYNNQYLGSFGATHKVFTDKNFCGEGGALFINDEDVERAEIIREKGTNRSNFQGRS